MAVFKQATTPVTNVKEGDLWILPGAPDTVYVCSDHSASIPVWILFANATLNPVAGVSSITGGTGITVDTPTGDVTVSADDTAMVASLAGTANQITASAATGAVTLSLPSAVTLPGSLTVTTRTGTAAKAAAFTSGGVLAEVTGADGTFTSADGSPKTITVTKGIITDIV